MPQQGITRITLERRWPPPACLFPQVRACWGLTGCCFQGFSIGAAVLRMHANACECRRVQHL